MLDGMWRALMVLTLLASSASADPINAGNASAQCRQEGMSGLVTVKVTARPDDESFTVTANAGNEAFLTCLRDNLREKLRSQYAVPRKLPDGTFERYFRIDANVDASATVKL